SVLDATDGRTDESGHGTWLAGIVVARPDNLQGIAGVGYDHVQVVPVRVLSSGGLGQDSDIIQGVMWAADNGADVILWPSAIPVSARACRTRSIMRGPRMSSSSPPPAMMEPVPPPFRQATRESSASRQQIRMMFSPPRVPTVRRSF